MTDKEYFHDIFKCLSYKQLGKAINLMHSYMAQSNPAAYSDQSLHSIEEDYRACSTTWSRDSRIPTATASVRNCCNGM